MHLADQFFIQCQWLHPTCKNVGDPAAPTLVGKWIHKHPPRDESLISWRKRRVHIQRKPWAIHPLAVSNFFKRINVMLYLRDLFSCILFALNDDNESPTLRYEKKCNELISCISHCFSSMNGIVSDLYSESQRTFETSGNDDVERTVINRISWSQGRQKGTVRNLFILSRKPFEHLNLHDYRKWYS